MYEVFDHTADLGLRVTAPDFEGLLAEAARGLFSIILENPDEIRSQQQVRLEIAGEQIEALEPLGIKGLSMVVFSIQDDLENLDRVSKELMPRFR